MTSGTKQFRKRNAILAYLRSTGTHPSAEMVYAQLKPEIPDLSMGTVYRNLSMFRQQGDIVSIGTVRGVERFDGNTQPHVHFICNECGQVVDLPQMQIPSGLTATAESLVGGRVDTCQLSFIGACGACITQEKGGESA